MAAGNASIASYQKALKSLYSSKDGAKILYEESQVLARVAKIDDFQGKDYSCALLYGNQQGVSATLAASIGGKSSTNIGGFTIPRAKLYGTGSIDREAMYAAESSKGSMIFNAVKTERDSLYREAGRVMSRFFFNDGTGTIGQVGSISTNTITLLNIKDAVWWSKDMTVQLSLANTASRAGTLVVAGVDRDLGIITFTTNVTAGIAAAAVNDYIYPNGNNAADAGVANIMGLGGWLVGSAATSTLFLGQDRSLDKLRLAGMTFTGNGAMKIQTLKSASAKCLVNNAKIDMAVVSPEDGADILDSLDSNVRYAERTGGDKNVKVGFSNAQIAGVGGNFDLVIDVGCPVGKFYMINLQSWELHTLGADGNMFFRLVDEDGVTMLRDSTTDSFSWRHVFMGGLMCRAPGWNLAGTF